MGFTKVRNFLKITYILFGSVGYFVYLCKRTLKLRTMEKVAVIVTPNKVANEREILDWFGTEEFDDVEHIITYLSGQRIKQEDVLIVPLHEFAEMWNDTDDDRTELEIKETFLGFANIK